MLKTGTGAATALAPGTTLAVLTVTGATLAAALPPTGLGAGLLTCLGIGFEV